MSLFVDTGVFYALHDRDAPRHEAAATAITRASSGELGRYDDQTLSFTDASTVALVEANDVDAVLSFDDDFDGIVDRIDPASL